MNKEEFKLRVRNILNGIDLDEVVSGEGWWETAGGARFGEKKLNELLELIDSEFVQEASK